MISIVGSETAAWAKLEEAQISTMEGIPLITVLDDQSHIDMGERHYTSKLLLALLPRAIPHPPIQCATLQSHHSKLGQPRLLGFSQFLANARLA